MNYKISYICISHIGRCRQMNQDNFICDGRYRELSETPSAAPVVRTGSLRSSQPSMLGVFDGMGGEERGEVAALLAAREAAKTPLNGDPTKSLLALCRRANARICLYAEQNGVLSTGTTAALLAFDPKGIALCNIGDSRIFCFSDGGLTQLSTDHVSAAPYGLKPPLSQNLGIPPTEMLIEPYTAKRKYREGEVYLICSDGLTDMVPPEEIGEILQTAAGKGTHDVLYTAAQQLLDRALGNGGKDNVTLILCGIAAEKGRFLAKSVV